MQKRFRAVYSGRVQNVGFRYFAEANAQRLGITGFVENLESGDVEVEAQGEEIPLEKYLAVLSAGNQFIQIFHVSLQEIPPLAEAKSFRCRW